MGKHTAPPLGAVLALAGARCYNEARVQVGVSVRQGRQGAGGPPALSISVFLLIRFGSVMCVPPKGFTSV